MLKPNLTAPSTNDSSAVQITDRVKRVNTELHFKLENLHKTIQTLLSNLYNKIDEIEDRKTRIPILETIWQIDTLLEVQRENLTYHDFEAVEDLVFELTYKND